jgi:hypothetical protein
MGASQTATAQDIVVAADISADIVPGAQPLLSVNAFTGFCTFHFNGTQVVKCSDPRINANSRVFMSVSEYHNSPTTGRIMGSASMSILNITPQAGDVLARIDVNWGSALDVRVDVLVDP